MKVVIVGRTRMGEGLCVGGITPAYTDVRLQPERGHAHPEDAPYQIGDVWELPLVTISGARPPHVEDMRLVGPGRRVDRVDDLGAWLLAGVSPWRGSADTVFGGRIQRTEGGRGFVGASDIPDCSVGFWIPDRPLLRVDRNEKEQYEYTDYQGARWRFSYAGTGPSVKLIPAGMLVRISLARWWSPPDSDLPEACYAQLSGWFPIAPTAPMSSDVGLSTESLRTHS